jgi:hypothetical protein
MAGEKPILMTDTTAARLQSLLRRRFSGSGGIEVRETPDSVTIALRRNAPADPEKPSCYLVKVLLDGGVAGDSTTRCTFTYAIYRRGGVVTDVDDQLAKLLTPAAARTSVGTYTAAADGTGGMAAIAPDGTWLLLAALDERPAVSTCDCA